MQKNDVRQGHDPVSALLERLEGVVPIASGWSARCPAHDDRHASLAVGVGDDGRVLLYCHTDCPAENVVQALGMTMADLYPASRNGTGSNGSPRLQHHPRQSAGAKAKDKKQYPTRKEALEALDYGMGRGQQARRAGKWIYRDARGDDVAAVVRYDLPTTEGERTRKEFRPLSKRGVSWVIGDPEGPWPLYQLPQLLDAGLVFVVEGEKCVERLSDIGLTATTSAHGARSPRKTDWSPLAGKDVIVIPDNDGPGEQYAAEVVRILQQLAPPATAKVVRLDGLGEHEDVIDWLANRSVMGMKLEESKKRLEQLADQAAVLEPPPPPTPDPAADPAWPDPPAEEAFHGLPGRIVRLIEPASEADPAALLVQTMVAFGNAVGREAHFQVEAGRHAGNEFVVLVGRSSKARKGTSWGHVFRLFEEADEVWAKEKVQTGLSSGEGLIWAVRDPILKRERVKERGEEARYEEVEADPGVADKRLLVYEPEFASVLKQTERQGNTLSALLRQSWDGGQLRAMTKNGPASATGAHISIVGHITADELRRYLTQTETANGYANRHLFVCAERSKLLPFGGAVDRKAWGELREELTAAVAFAKSAGEVVCDGEAREIWGEVYGPLSDGRPGLAGALLARAEAHVMRLAMLYALMDRSSEIRAPHLMAAIALWENAERSVLFVFGDGLGDPLADDLLRLLRSCPAGLTRNDITNYLGRHHPAERVGQALGLLLKHRLARQERQNTGGRPAERWFAATRGRGE
jgi:hypothetical protein